MSICRCLLILWLAGLAGNAEGAIVQWTDNGHWYEAVSVPGGITWFDAYDASVAAGGYLATITSDEENAFVFDLVNDDVSAYWRMSFVLYGPWLGGFQKDGYREPDNGWTWVTGEDFSYENWRGGQPSDTGGIQDHVHYVADRDNNSAPASTWNDTYGGTTDDYVISYVIEYDTNPVPEPTSLAVFWCLGVMGMITCRRRRNPKA